MITMTTSSPSPTTSRAPKAPADAAPEQLTLLVPSSQPLQFRLSKETRQRGLAHIAAIRRQLAQRGHAA